MSAYVVVSPGGIALYQDGLFDAASLDGPPTPPPVVAPNVAVLLLEPIDWDSKPTPYHVLMWQSQVWVAPAELDEQKAAAIAATYPDVDAVYEAAIGKREPEYTEAEEAARHYMAAPVKPVPVSDYITGHARSNPTGQQQSDDWAAQQIIERADAFKWAKLQMRNVRFDRQADMRAAVTPEELAAAVASWTDFITWLRTTLGL